MGGPHKYARAARSSAQGGAYAENFVSEAEGDALGRSIAAQHAPMIRLECHHFDGIEVLNTATNAFVV